MTRAPLDKPPKFVWPPGLPADAPPPPPEATAAEAPPGWWRVFEEELLGRSAGPFTQRAADVGWTPDSRIDSCPRCGSDVREHEPALADGAAGVDCSWCREQRLPWRRFVRLGAYDGVLRDAVLELKFTAWRAVGLELGRLLGQRLKEELAHARIPEQRVALVPVPASWRRRLSRGVDHTLVLARGMRQTCDVRLARVLSRRHGPPQVGLTGADRARNVRGAFRAGGRLPADTQLVVVVDDVRTTGATMRAACREARRFVKRLGVGPVEVWGCAVGVTPTAGVGGLGGGATESAQA
ncbi:MAG: hypothetical protein SFY96_12655 [Planctomycetota bacterium]|nr:hypothetical protein [Planctomycetota bacterium]